MASYGGGSGAGGGAGAASSSTANDESALADIIAQTDEHGKPTYMATATTTTVHTNAASVAAHTRTKKKRGCLAWLCCCCCRGDGDDAKAARKAAAAYYVDDIDSIEVDFAEVARLRTQTPRPLLPRMRTQDKGKKCLVLDLDETLVHSSFKPIPNPDYVLPVEIEHTLHHVYVCKRPGCDLLLQSLAPFYEIIVFTASLAKYADPLLDQLDTMGVVRARLFREQCVVYQGKYVKDLALMGRDLSQTIIVDNSPCSYLFHPENAIACDTFLADPADRELFALTKFLESIKHAADVRKVLPSWEQGGGSFR